MLYLVHRLIDEVASAFPERDAVRFRDSRLSYSQLVERARKLSHTLKEQGVRRGDRVGIFKNKSLESVVAMYGIMGAGAAYVPLDPAAPPARTEFVLRDCGIRHVVTDNRKGAELGELIAGGLEIDCLIGASELEGVNARCVSWAEVEAAPCTSWSGEPMVEEDLLYIMFTSGSTGTPKGIMHTHRSCLCFVLWGAKICGLRGDDVLSNHGPMHFDLSIFDYFAAAKAGATTVMTPEEYTKIPTSCAQLWSREKISVVMTVPFTLIQLLTWGNLESQDLSSLRLIISTGESIQSKHLGALIRKLPHVTFSNMYGPGETGTEVTSYIVPPYYDPDGGPVPIGRMGDHMEMLLLDENDRPVEAGKPGELLIRGGQTMLGYWGRPDLTAHAFYRKQMAGGYEHVFYRTGDIVRLREDGELIFLGRNDRQVKIRGHRVELDEIEAAITSHPLVVEAAVFIVPEEMGSNRVEAVAIPRQEGLDSSELLAFLREKLPPYALPRHIEIAAEFPRTSSGKIDRKVLRANSEEGGKATG